MGLVAPLIVLVTLSFAPAAPAGGVIEQAKIEPAMATSGSERFGSSVSLVGSTALIGARSQGAAYVFVGQGTTWMQQAKLLGAAQIGTEFGTSVELSGDTAVVGAPYENHAGLIYPGAAYVFVRSGTVWTQQARLTAPNPADFERFGTAVSISGDTLVAGAPQDPAGGAAQVYVRNGTVWSHQTKLTSSVPAWLFGDAVAVGGNTVLVGSYSASQAFVFVRTGTSWTEQAVLSSGNGAVGQSVDLEQGRAVLGAPFEGNGDDGAAYVFRRQEGGWIQEARLVPAVSSNYDEFGFSVALSGERVVVGSIQHNGEEPEGPGEAHVFQRAGTTWSETAGFTGSDSKLGDQFGHSVAIDGGEILVGADHATNAGGPFGGAAYFFGDPSVAVAYCTAGTSASGCTASLSATGVASATATTGFDLSAAGVEGQKDGLFFFGAQGRQANPWGNGSSYQCVVPPVSRGGLLLGAGTAGQCDGSFGQDLNARWTTKPNQNPGAGAAVQAQLWYRDPLSTSNRTTSLSDALEFVVAP